jgi:AraC-like DNA-binding protein
MDLVPGYREIPPPPGLEHVVACVWLRVTGTSDEVRVIPDGCTDVVWQRGVGVTVAGPDTTPKLLDRASDDVLIGLRLRPGAGGGVLGIPLDELRDARVDVADVDRALALEAELPPDEVVRRLLSAAAGRTVDPLVAEATRRLGQQEVRELARDLWVSERQLRRRFHAAVGYGPKTLGRVLRFRRVLDGLDRGRTDLARLALDAGYADQAHLTRETKRLAGLPPLELIKSRALRDTSVSFKT